MVGAFPFDLHVLSTPPAFVLSQDQTLQKNKQKTNRQKTKKSTKQQQTTNTINNYWCSCSCSCTNKVCFIKWHTIEFSNNTTTHNPTPKMQSRKQRPHKYTNPTPKPQTPTSQQQKPGKTIQSLLACTLDVTNTGTWAHTSIDIIMVAAKLKLIQAFEITTPTTRWTITPESIGKRGR